MTAGVLIIIAFFVFGIRLVSRLADRRDAAICAFVAVNASLVLLQQLVGDRYVSWLDGRYYYCTAIMSLAFLALRLPRLPVFFDKYSLLITRILKLAIVIAILVSAITSIWTPIKGAFKESRRSNRAKADRWAASIILQDYNGPENDETFHFDLANYKTPRLPKIYTEDGGVNVAQLVHGSWTGNLRNADYALLPSSSSCSDEFILIAEQSFGTKHHVYKLYKRKPKVN